MQQCERKRRRAGGFGPFGEFPARLRRATPTHRLLLFLITGVISALFAVPARSQFQVCNQTFDVLNLAIARFVAESIQSEGWWTIGANRCVNVIKEKLESQYIYVYAADVFDQPIVDGTREFCIGAKRFLINGNDSCWQRGHKVARFMEVDTQAVERWTLILKDPTSN